MNKKNIVFASLLCFALTAATAVMAQGEDASVVPMLSGGVGEDEMDQLKSVQNQYNLKLLFTAATGDYLSEVTVKISDSNGHVVVDTVASGPVFLATLPPGKYKVQAISDEDGTVAQRVTVEGKTLRSYQLRFTGKN